MPLVEQIGRNLVDPEKHAPILRALIDILVEEGEKGLRDRIKQLVQEIEEESPDDQETEEV